VQLKAFWNVWSWIRDRWTLYILFKIVRLTMVPWKAASTFVRFLILQKYRRKLFILLDYSSNQMKKKLRIRKKLLQIFSKIQWKKYFFGSNKFKTKDFSKILKTDDDLHYLAKFEERLFSKTHLDAKNNFLWRHQSWKSLIKNVLLYRKRTRKVDLNIFASVDQNPRWKFQMNLSKMKWLKERKILKKPEKAQIFVWKPILEPRGLKKPKSKRETKSVEWFWSK
jgi:hypothetical protein